MTTFKLLGVLLILGAGLYASMWLDATQRQKIIKANRVSVIHTITDCEASNRKWKYYEGSDDLICYIFPETK